MTPVYGVPSLAMLAVAFALAGCNDSPTGTDPLTANLWTCAGEVEGGALRNVVVRRGDECGLTGVTVQGNIDVKEGGSLVLEGGSVSGNVQGDEAASVEIRGTEVGGNVQVQESGSVLVVDALVRGDIQVQKIRNAADGIVVVVDNEVLTGNIQIQENLVQLLDISRNSVRKGNLQITKNFGSGSKVVIGNTVAQNLECKENSDPFTAVGNSAGDREGQCQ